jgi:hypothetical protein
MPGGKGKTAKCTDQKELWTTLVRRALYGKSAATVERSAVRIPESAKTRQKLVTCEITAGMPWQAWFEIE